MYKSHLRELWNFVVKRWYNRKRTNEVSYSSKINYDTLNAYSKRFNK